MAQTTWIAVVLGTWSVLYLIDAFLKVSNQVWTGLFLIIIKFNCKVF